LHKENGDQLLSQYPRQKGGIALRVGEKTGKKSGDWQMLQGKKKKNLSTNASMRHPFYSKILKPICSPKRDGGEF